MAIFFIMQYSNNISNVIQLTLNSRRFKIRYNFLDVDGWEPSLDICASWSDLRPPPPVSRLVVVGVDYLSGGED